MQSSKMIFRCAALVAAPGATGLTMQNLKMGVYDKLSQGVLGLKTNVLSKGAKMMRKLQHYATSVEGQPQEQTSEPERNQPASLREIKRNLVANLKDINQQIKNLEQSNDAMNLRKVVLENKVALQAALDKMKALGKNDTVDTKEAMNALRQHKDLLKPLRTKRNGIIKALDEVMLAELQEAELQEAERDHQLAKLQEEIWNLATMQEEIWSLDPDPRVIDRLRKDEFINEENKREEAAMRQRERALQARLDQLFAQNQAQEQRETEELDRMMMEAGLENQVQEPTEAELEELEQMMMEMNLDDE